MTLIGACRDVLRVIRPERGAQPEATKLLSEAVSATVVGAVVLDFAPSERTERTRVSLQRARLETPPDPRVAPRAPPHALIERGIGATHGRHTPSWSAGQRWSGSSMYSPQNSQRGRAAGRSRLTAHPRRPAATYQEMREKGYISSGPAQIRTAVTATRCLPFCRFRASVNCYDRTTRPYRHVAGGGT
jgi:hypothetical protein